MRHLATSTTAALGTVAILALGTGLHMTRTCHAAHAQYLPQLSSRCIKGYKYGEAP